MIKNSKNIDQVDDESPLITIVIPAFDRPDQLAGAIDSVQSQTVTDFELIVVDDASSLDSGDFPEDITWLKNETNLGPAASRNRGANAGRGKWIAFLDSDDTWFPGKLERQIAFHEAHPEIRISQCEEIWIRNGKRVRKPTHLAQPAGEIFAECTRRCCISPSAVMIERSLWDSCNGFDEFFRICEDYELWMRLAVTEEFGLIPGEDLVAKYGGHPDQLTANVEHGIDRWRVLALQKQLNDNRLSEPQFQAVVTALHEKARIAAKQRHRRLGLNE